MQRLTIILGIVVVVVAFFLSAFAMRRSVEQQALKQAVISGDEITASQILGSRPAYATEYRGRHGITLLHLAAGNGHSNLVTMLLKHGADIDARTAGLTPLIQAVNYGRVGCVHVLVANGANVNLKGPLERTALFYAMSQPSIAEFLLQNGADPNVRDFSGQSPLHRACDVGDIDCVKLLIAASADPNRTDNAGETPLAVAERQGYAAIVNYLREHIGSAR